ncbi:MAG TPA: AIR synthase-related protein, partial [Candidatus Caenarcaniphilales bacterium]
WHDYPGERLREHSEIHNDESLAAVLTTPTRIYVKPVLAALQAGLEIHGMAHITGGGLPENLPRCLGPDQSVQVDPQQWQVPHIFAWIATVGHVPTRAMFSTFNMGIGFVVLVSPGHVEQALRWFIGQDIAAYNIGEVVKGEGLVIGLPD